MGDILCPVRVYWEAGGGVAKTPGFRRQLTAAPVIPGLPLITTIDYAPGVCSLVLPYMGHLRSLEDGEISAIHAWLAGLVLCPERTPS